ncbi:MAG: hypothetical protein WCS62_02800 [Bacilli bacterium]
MPRRISAETDMQILADVGLGMLHKDVAVKYGVSASYVSKLTSGKKIPYIHIPEPSKIIDEEFEIYEDEVEAIINNISKKKILVSNGDVIKYLQTQINRSVIRIKMYLELIKKYKGE